MQEMAAENLRYVSRGSIPLSYAFPALSREGGESGGPYVDMLACLAMRIGG